MAPTATATPSRVTILQKRPQQQDSNLFWRKTARGRVQRVVREHYLRPVADFAAPPSTVTKWLVVDTNIVLHQIDLLSAAKFPLPLLVPQTVLDEVRHRSLPLYNKFKALLDDDLPASSPATKRGFVVWNEATEELYIRQRQGESPNDRNDRAIRHFAAFFANTLSTRDIQDSKRRKTSTSLPRQPSESGSRVLLLSDDADNRRKAAAEAIAAVSVKEFVQQQAHDVQAELSDLVAAPTHGRDRRSGEPFFDEYLLPSVLQAGVKCGKLFQGHFNPSQFNYKEAFVAVAGRDKPILLAGLKSMNRAVAGDIVVVEILPESEWQGAADDVVESDSETRLDDPDADVAEDDLGELKRTQPTQKKQAHRQPTGKVVGIVKRNWRTYVCHLDRASLSPAALASNTSVSVFASPVSRSIPRIRILTRQAASLSRQKFLVSIDSWPITSKYPEGHFVRVLGEVGSKQGELESLLEEWEIPYRPFSAAILSCLPQEGDKWVVPPKDDDPERCQDIDDALHAKLLPNGNIEAAVHIADVSHFVHPDNPMDAEAASRGTTVYLVDKRIDMLPSLLGTNLCSLRPYVERLAFSVIWEMTSDAEIVNVRFSKSVIASKEAFTYEAAQKRKDDRSLDDPLTNGIRLLNSIAIKLRNKRMEAGALNLASPEVKIHMDSTESTEPVDVEQKALFETNSLVEEFMLLANISVAQKIYEQFPQTAVLRRHAAPPKTNFEVLQDVLARRKNIALDVSTSRALADSLDSCIDPNLPEFNTLVRIMATRCMLSAEYFCSGSIARDAFGHYGLASPIYTHFTSPIRRYADVLVHRQLAAAMSATPLHAGLQTKSFVEKTLDVVNKRHRSAQQAARASIEFYVALAIQNREELSVKKGGGKVRADAFVIRTFRNGLAVFVSQFGLEGLVMFKRENEYNAETYEITVPSGSSPVTLGVFDRVTVEISVEKDRSTQRGKVIMTLVEPVDSRAL
ncbi:exosome catalytic subunit dis3 [Microbotryomycetes sp. JL221]|nr:exosome catalytic subunit dis3 [Microbotryomycetes sp. JL221]